MWGSLQGKTYFPVALKVKWHMFLSFPLLFFMCIAFLFRTAFPYKPATRVAGNSVFRTLECKRENPRKGRFCMAWLCLGAGQCGYKNMPSPMWNEWQLHKHSFGSSGGAACTPREGESCSQLTRVPFVFHKCVWHRNTPSTDRGIIRACYSRSPALPHCMQGASQVLTRLDTQSVPPKPSVVPAEP